MAHPLGRAGCLRRRQGLEAGVRTKQRRNLRGQSLCSVGTGAKFDPRSPGQKPGVAHAWILALRRQVDP